MLSIENMILLFSDGTPLIDPDWIS